MARPAYFGMIARRLALCSVVFCLVAHCSPTPVVDEPCTPDDAFSLLQVHAEPNDQRQQLDKKSTIEAMTSLKRKTAGLDNSETDGQCLKFMHIPRTGGSSIDSVNMHLSSPAFDSLMYQTYKRISKTNTTMFEKQFHSNLGVMFDDSHRTYAHYITSFLLDHYDSYNIIEQPDGLSCQDLHTPPVLYNTDIVKYYAEDRCTIFCAVRDPMERFISAYEMMHVGPCDPSGFETQVHALFAELRRHPSNDFCLFLPQVFFVYGAPSKSVAIKQYCHEVLHTEHLNTEFDSLMKKLSVSLELPAKHLMATGSAIKGCTVDRTGMTQKAKKMIFDYYKNDYEAFGYPYS
jgi:hypothetical protein